MPDTREVVTSSPSMSLSPNSQKITHVREMNLSDEAIELNDSDISSDYDSDIDDLSEPQHMSVPVNGILTNNIVRTSLTEMGRTADDSQLAHLKLSLSKLNLLTITVLEKYMHIQYLYLNHNRLQDLSILSNMPYLLELYVANNELSDLLNFDPPRNLRIADFSFNKITLIPDLSAHHSLQKLELASNQILRIAGLLNCKRLKHLNLDNNQIEIIEGLNDLPLQYLNLSNNNIHKIESIDSLNSICHLLLANNHIRSLKGIVAFSFLHTVDISGNDIVDVWELEHLRPLLSLSKLNIENNPVEEISDFRLCVLFHLQRLTSLNSNDVQIDEKVAAVNQFNPPPQLVAARDHMMHTVYNFILPVNLKDSTLASPDTPYPILVIVGPEGSGRKELAKQLATDFSDYFGYAVMHTTRKLYDFEENGKDLYTLLEDDFRNEIKCGQFIYTYHYANHWYGLMRDCIEMIARDGLASIIQMELEGALSFRKTHFEPRFILVVPRNRTGFEKRLTEYGVYTDDEISYMLDRVDEYESFNQENPGIFDYVVKTDDIENEAYTILKHLVMNYLGISNGNKEATNEINGNNEQIGRGLVDEPPALVASSSSTSDLIFKGLQQAVQGRKLTSMSNKGSGRKMSSDMGNTIKKRHQLSRENTTPRMTRPGGLPPSRGAIEEASIKRRFDLAKEAVTSYIPSFVDDIYRRIPEGHNLINEDVLPPDEARLVSSAPPCQIFNVGTDSALPPPTSPDSSQQEFRYTSENSIPSSATHLNQQQQKGQLENEDLLPIPPLPLEQIDRISLLTGSATENRQQTKGDEIESERNNVTPTQPLINPLPPARPTSSCGNRRVNDDIRILPPIGNNANEDNNMKD